MNNLFLKAAEQKYHNKVQHVYKTHFGPKKTRGSKKY